MLGFNKSLHSNAAVQTAAHNTATAAFISHRLTTTVIIMPIGTEAAIISIKKSNHPPPKLIGCFFCLQTFSHTLYSSFYCLLKVYHSEIFLATIFNKSKNISKNLYENEKRGTEHSTPQNLFISTLFMILAAVVYGKGSVNLLA